MSPPIRLDDCLGWIVMKSKSQHHEDLVGKIGVSAGLLYSAADHIKMISDGNHSIMFITPPYRLSFN